MLRIPGIYRLAAGLFPSSKLLPRKYDTKFIAPFAARHRHMIINVLLVYRVIFGGRIKELGREGGREKKGARDGTKQINKKKTVFTVVP